MDRGACSFGKMYIVKTDPTPAQHEPVIYLRGKISTTKAFDMIQLPGPENLVGQPDPRLVTTW